MATSPSRDLRDQDGHGDQEDKAMKVFITGGAGFIGCNVADYHLRKGDEVVIFDNLSRSGTRANLQWLRDRHGSHAMTFALGDVRAAPSIERALPRDVDVVYHFAAQVAVTTSVTYPRDDFFTNAFGTFNVLEAVRQNSPNATLLYASTNKVYGGMESVAIVEEPSRYRYRDLPDGIPEDQGLDFHSPYGCSKGAGDQYVRDYARIYGLRTVVMRQSCIYGPRQFGVEDQGWLAHFCICARLGRPITIYGNGKQARDVLWIGDLIAAYAAAVDRIDTVAGEVFNIGGGPDHTVSIWSEFGSELTDLAAGAPLVEYGDWRPGDQPVYVSDISKAGRELGWEPTVPVREGLARLWQWVDENAELFGGVAVAV
jgi:CDP-paratose 2-epimerase